jgi:hypothetical protein
LESWYPEGVSDGLAPDAANDDEMLARLRAHAAKVHGPSELFVRVAKEIFSLRNLDVELAELLSDSALTAAATRSDVRSSVEGRVLSYELRPGRLDVRIGEDAVTGQVRVGGRPALFWHSGRAEDPLELDDDGAFVIVPVPSGPFAFRVEIDDDRVLMTDWLSA